MRAAVEELLDRISPERTRRLPRPLAGETPAVYRGIPVLMSAIAGIDQALWDIKGKQLGAPVHQLLGGQARDRIRVYQWIGGDEPSDVASAAQEQVDAGFTALKMNATPEIERVDNPATVEAAATRSGRSGRPSVPRSTSASTSTVASRSRWASGSRPRWSL